MLGTKINMHHLTIFTTSSLFTVQIKKLSLKCLALWYNPDIYTVGSTDTQSSF